MGQTVNVRKILGWCRRFGYRSIHFGRKADLNRANPLHLDFGYRRGTPVDRMYIEKFLQINAGLIRGRSLEVAERRYTDGRIGQIDEAIILSLDQPGPGVITGDLTKLESLPVSAFDCFVCTQTLNFLVDPAAALAGCRRLLKPGGHLLLTVSGATVPISRYDSERWGDYWRFTEQGINRLVDQVFAGARRETVVFGNALAATAMIHGLVCEELDERDLAVTNPLFPVIIGIIAQRVPDRD